MGHSEADSEHVRKRFRAFVEEVGAEMNHVRGWKSQVAEKLGITLAHLSRVMAGSRGVSVELLDRAAWVYGFDRVYFFFPDTEDSSSYHKFPRPSEFEAAHARARPHREFETLRRMASQIIQSFAQTRTVPPELAKGLARGILSQPAVQSAMDVEGGTARSDHEAGMMAVMMAAGFLMLLEDKAAQPEADSEEPDSKTG